MKNLEYTVNKGTVAVTKYTGTGGAVIIPETIDDLPITSIGYAAFPDATKLIRA